MIYFAYGSLLDPHRLSELCPKAERLRLARIPNHKLCFTGRSERWGGGTATIGLAPAYDLWGGLYEIDSDGRAQIEECGVADGYVWAFSSVEDRDGERIPAGMLIKVRDLEPSDPSDEYLAVLKAGWAEWGLDPEELLRDDPPPD